MEIRKNILKISARWGEYPAILALLLMLLAPLSPVWAPLISQDAKTLQICTLQGLQNIVFKTDKTSGANSGETDQKNNKAPCPFCHVRDIQDLANTSIPYSLYEVPDFFAYGFYDNIETDFPSYVFLKGRRTRAPPQYS